MNQKVRITRWIIGGSLFLIGMGIIISTSLPKSVQYYMTVDELLLKPNLTPNQPLRIAGIVKPGSLQHEPQNLSWNFQVENAGQALWVYYRGALPDTFREGINVVVTGKLTPNRQMVATQILSKCASKYSNKIQGTP